MQKKEMNEEINPKTAEGNTCSYDLKHTYIWI